MYSTIVSALVTSGLLFAAAYGVLTLVDVDGDAFEPNDERTSYDHEPPTHGNASDGTCAAAPSPDDGNDASSDCS